MSIVVDVSIAAPWVLADEHHVLSVKLLDLLSADSIAVVPMIWHFEFGNLLAVSRRRGRMNARECARAITLATSLGLQTDDTIALGATLAVANRRALSFYDAAYLELALRRGLTLATLDKRLGTAAVAEGVALLE